MLTTNFKEGVSFATFTPDNRMVYAITNLGRDKDALVLMDPATCEEKEGLYTNDTYDLAGVWYSEKEKKLLGVSYEGHKGTTRHFFDREAGELFGRMERHLRGYELGIVGSDKAEDKYIVYAGSDRTAGAYYIYDVAADTMTKLADLRPWIKQEEMAEMLPIEYTARDGERIEGYLTLPVGKTLRNAKNLPVVVNPHGGPWARDSWGFNPEAQFLANRGYAVLQMNFRGSTGFGRRFTEIAFGKWGQEMQDDITDGVNWLIGKGIADPARIAIYGGSYGGYATLQGIVKDPDLYACAIDYVGVSNLFSFLNTIPPYWKPLLDQMYEMVGNPETQQEMLRENSPALNAGRIKTPLLVVQGANDPRVNINESNQMVERCAHAAWRWTTWSRTTKATDSTTRRTASTSTAPWRSSSASTSRASGPRATSSPKAAAGKGSGNRICEPQPFKIKSSNPGRPGRRLSYRPPRRKSPYDSCATKARNFRAFCPEKPGKIPTFAVAMHAAPHIPQRPADGLPMPQRLGAILAVAFGVSLSVIDGTVANVALPTIGQQLGISAADSIWIVNAYQLAIMVSLLSLSALGDVVGYRKVYIGGLMLFTVASVGCSLSGSLQALVLARVMQGFGAAAITSVNTSLIRFIYPKARLGRGMGVNATVVATSSVAGPDAGGGHPLRGRLAVAVRRERPDRAGRPGAQPPVPAGESRTGARTPASTGATQ